MLHPNDTTTNKSHRSDYFTTAVRTSDKGMNGISVLLIERSFGGVSTRRMDCQGVWSSGTTYITFEDVKVPVENLIGKENGGFKVIMTNFNHERIGIIIQAVRFSRVCYEESVKYARNRKPFGKPLSDNQAIQWPLVELATQCEMLRLLIRKTAWEMDQMDHKTVERTLSDKVSMCNYWGNRLVCEAADRAMQVHGGIGNTWECVVHLYVRRALLSSQWFGDDGEQLRQLQRERLGATI